MRSSDSWTPDIRQGIAGLFVAITLLSTVFAAGAAAYRECAPGDANGDSLVTAADASHILRQLAGLEAANPLCAGSDANGDSAVTLHDVLAIRRWVAGLPVPPNLTSVLPGSVPAGSNDTTFTLTGGFIAPNTVVSWNGTPYAVTLVDSGSTATVVIPASAFASEGSATIRLQTPGQQLSGPFAFEVTEPGTCSMPVATSGTLVVDKEEETARFTLNAPQDMTGWTLFSELGGQMYEFPDGYFYNPALEPVTVVSGTAKIEDTQTLLWWQVAPVWNNGDRDPGFIRDCDLNIIAAWPDPATPGD